MSNIGTAIQQSVGIPAMLVTQGQRKECRNSTESTGARATSNSFFFFAIKKPVFFFFFFFFFFAKNKPFFFFFFFFFFFLLQILIHTVSVQTHQISGIHFLKTKRRTSRKTKTHIIHLNYSSLRTSHGLH